MPKIVAQTEVGKTVKVKVWRNKKLISKKITLGRLETSEDFKIEKVEDKKEEVLEIKSLKISVRTLTKRDIENRKLPKGIVGLVITSIANDSPINSLEINDIIVEVQKKKIRSAKILNEIIESTLKSNEKTLLFTIYNNQNQRRYLGVKLK